MSSHRILYARPAHRIGYSPQWSLTIVQEASSTHARHPMPSLAQVLHPKLKHGGNLNTEEDGSRHGHDGSCRPKQSLLARSMGNLLRPLPVLWSAYSRRIPTRQAKAATMGIAGRLPFSRVRDPSPVLFFVMCYAYSSI